MSEVEAMLHSVDEQERVRKRFQAKLFEYLGVRGQWQQKFGQYTDEEFHAAAMAKLVRIPGLGLTNEQAEALLDQSAVELLHASIVAVQPVIENDLAQLEMYYEIVENVNAFFDTLKQYEFMTRSVTGLSAIASGAAAGTALTDLKELRTKLQRGKQALEKAAALKGGRALKDIVEEERQALRDHLRDFEAFHKDLAAISKKADAAVAKAAGAIDEQALYIFYLENPDKAREKIEKIAKAAGFVNGFAGTFTPPGYKWINGLIDFTKTLTSRSADEILIMQAVNKHRETNAAGSVFEEYTKDPKLLAKGLAKTIERNVELLLSGIGIFGEEIPGWAFIESAVKGVINGWQENRIEEAKHLLDAMKPLTKAEFEEQRKREEAAKHLETFMAQELDEFVEGSKKMLEEQLGEAVKEGGNWGAGAVLLFSEEAAKKEDTVQDVLKDFAASLVEPIVKKVISIIPATPAQIVSGEDLTSLVNAALVAVALPDNWRKLSLPTISADERKEHPPTEIFKSAYGWTPRGSNANQDILENGKTVKQWVAYWRLGVLIWGYVDAKGEFTPERAEFTEDAAWNTRKITNTGYDEPGESGQSGGKWHTLREPKLKGYFVFEHSGGTTYEWIHKITSTRIGTAESIQMPTTELSIFD